MYERHGDCRGCGLRCCTFVAFFAPKGVPAKVWAEQVKEHGHIDVAPSDAPDFANWLKAHNLSAVPVGGPYFRVYLNSAQRKLLSLLRLMGRAAVTLPAKCKHLREDGKCGIYGEAERPKMCDTFPAHPLELVGISEDPLTENPEGCGYYFSEQSQGD